MGKELNRRAFLAGTASTATVAAVIAAPAVALAVSDPVSRRAGELLATILDTRAEQHQLGAEIAAIKEALPAWVRPGYEQINWKGEYSGRIVPWPEIADTSAPDSEIVYRCVRPSLAEVWKRNTMFMVPDGPSRQAQRRKAFAAVRRWIEREREAQAIKEAAGYRPLETKFDRLSDRINEAEDGLHEMQDRSGNADLIAARLVMVLADDSHWNDADRNAYFELPQLWLLSIIESVADKTTGYVREVCAELLADTKATRAGEV